MLLDDPNTLIAVMSWKLDEVMRGYKGGGKARTHHTMNTQMANFN
jgi:hypothetical protein